MKLLQLPAVLLSAATLMFPIDLRAADIVWTNPASGNWNVAASWSPNRVPSVSDNAYITNSGIYTVTLNVAATVASLTVGGASGTQTFTNSSQTLTLNGASTVNANGVFSMSGGTLTGPGDLTANGLFNWTGGTISGASRLFANGGLTISGLPKTLTGRTLVNAGAATWSAGQINLASGGVLSNAVTGTFDCAFDGTTGNGGGGGQAVANAGLFRKTAGTGATTIGSPISFNNTGTVEVKSGTLNLNGGGTDTGDFTVALGTTLNLGGGTHNLTSGNITGAGKFSVNGGVANFSGTLGFTSLLTVVANTANFNGGGGAITLAQLNLIGGTLGGSNNVSVSGAMTWTSGTINGTNNIFANGGLTITGAGGKNLRGRTLINAGAATWGGGVISLGSGGVLSNAVTGTFDCAFDGSMANGLGTGLTVGNAGLFRKTAGAGATTINNPIAFHNTGTVEVRSGSLSFGAACVQTAGLMLLNGGNLTVAQPFQLLGGTLAGTNIVFGSVTNNGFVSPGASPGRLTITGVYTQTANGALNIELAGTSAGVTFDQLIVSSAMTLAGALNVTLPNGFNPAPNDIFTDVVRAASRSGTFASFNFPLNVAGLRIKYGTAKVDLEVINTDATQPPILTTPLPGTLTKSPVSVSFTLPEVALAGSVRLSFGANTLVLAANQESAGPHSFSFDPANPSASPQIASGSPIADGNYTITLAYQDAAGNPTASAASANVTLDTTPPETLIDSGPSGTVTSTGATFTFSSNEAGASFLASLDGAPASAATSPANYPGLATGPHTFRVSATDAAGNADPTPAIRSWTIAPSGSSPIVQRWVQRYDSPGFSYDHASAVAVDAAGNVVVTGNGDVVTTGDGDGDATGGAGASGYTAKYSAANGALLWGANFKDSAGVAGNFSGVATDANGNVFVTGSHTVKRAASNGAVLWARLEPDYGADLAVDAAGNVIVITTIRETIFSDLDYYTVKYAAATGAVLWSARYDGPGAGGNDNPQSVAVDSAGNVIVTGTSHDGTREEIYTAKYAAATGALLWEHRYEEASGSGNSVAVDALGNVAITGGSFLIASQADFYTAKYAAANGALLWEVRYNGPHNSTDAAVSVGMDAAGNVAVTGVSFSATGEDYYTAKYAAANGALLWAVRYNGPGDNADRPAELAVDAEGNVVVTGESTGGDRDYYTVKYAAADGAIVWSQRYDGGNGGDVMSIASQGRKIALTAGGGAVVTGQSVGPDFDYDYATVYYGPPATTPPQTALEQWRGVTFGVNANNLAIAGNAADPDGDGGPNVFEYARGSDPLDPNSVARQSWAFEGGSLLYFYDRRMGTTGITSGMQKSDDLKTWVNASFTEEILSNNGVTEKVKATVAIETNNPSQPKSFLRPTIIVAP